MSDEREDSPSAPSVFRGAMFNFMKDIHTSMPGVIKSYSESTGRASVTPLIMRAVRGEEGQRLAEAYQVINEVPIIFPGPGRRIKWDLLPGDGVLIHFSEASLDKWKARNKASSKPLDPLRDQRFSLEDAVAVPGLEHLATDRTPQIIFVGMQIRAGGSAALATAAELTAVKNATAAAFNAITPLSGNPVSAIPTGGTNVLKGS